MDTAASLLEKSREAEIVDIAVEIVRSGLAAYHVQRCVNREIPAAQIDMLADMGATRFRTMFEEALSERSER
jgi:hypothetical protein